MALLAAWALFPLLLLLLPSPSSSAAAAATAHHWRVATVSSPPLASLLGDGSVSGYLPDLLRAVKIQAAKDSVTLSFEFHASATVDDALASLASGSREMLLSNELLHPLAVGGALMEYTAPWKSSGLALLRRQGSTGATTLAGLKHSAGRLCLIKSQGLEAMVKTREAALASGHFSCNRLSDCVDALRSGICGLLIAERLQAELLAKEDMNVDLVPNGVTAFPDRGLVFPVSPQVTTLKRLLLSKYLLAVVDNGTAIEELDQRYLGKPSAGTLKGTLASYSVHIVVVIDAPLVMFDSRGERNARFTGYCIDMISAAAQELGFEYTLSLPSDANLTRSPSPSFGTYGKGQQDVEDGTHPAQLFWAGYFVTKSRMQVVDFAHPFRTTPLQLVVRSKASMKKALPAAQAIFFPFTPALWMLLFATAVYSAVILWFLEAPPRHQNGQVEGKLGRTCEGAWLNSGGSLYLALGTELGFIAHEPKTCSGRLYSFCFMFFAMLTIAAYTANLASIMTTEAKVDGAIGSMEELVASGAPVCALANTAMGNWLQYDSPWAADVNIRWTSTSVAMARALRMGHCDGLIDRDIVVNYLLASPSNCGLKKAGGVFWQQSMGVGISKALGTTEFGKQLSHWIVSKREDGSLAEMEDEYTVSAGNDPCAEENQMPGARRRRRLRQKRRRRSRRLKGSGGSSAVGADVLDEAVSDEGMDELAMLESMRLDVSHVLIIIYALLIVGLSSVLINMLIVEPVHKHMVRKRVAKSLEKLRVCANSYPLGANGSAGGSGGGGARSAQANVNDGLDMDVILEAWKEIDHNAEGTVGKESFHIFFEELLKQLGITKAETRAIATKHVMDKIDADHDGQIDYEEFSEFVKTGELRRFIRRHSSSDLRRLSNEMMSSSDSTSGSDQKQRQPHRRQRQRQRPTHKRSFMRAATVLEGHKRRRSSSIGGGAAVAKEHSAPPQARPSSSSPPSSFALSKTRMGAEEEVDKHGDAAVRMPELHSFLQQCSAAEAEDRDLQLTPTMLLKAQARDRTGEAWTASAIQMQRKENKERRRRFQAEAEAEAKAKAASRTRTSGVHDAKERHHAGKKSELN